MGADFAENTMDSLLQGGMTRSQAMNTMADPAFQEKVVAEIARLAGIDLTSVGALDQTLQTDNKPNSPGSIELPATPVNASDAENLLLLKTHCDRWLRSTNTSRSIQISRRL
ncbi:hypothetical protein KP808_14600 [Pseudomonas savastanoi]|nr:hypothetical protein [Pseudomonas savastanoi]UFI43043.1 hypothetical protein KP808_14600 [Pseudomonas savastanoi]